MTSSARGVSPAPYADELASRIVQPLDDFLEVALDEDPHGLRA